MGEWNFDITDNTGLAKQTGPLCPAQTARLLNHPLRSSSESICAGQLEVQSVWEWGLCQQSPGAASVPPPRSHAGQPNEPALTGFQPHCSTAHNTAAHTPQETERGYSASHRRDTQRRLMGHFTLWPFSSMLTSWAMSYSSFSGHRAPGQQHSESWYLIWSFIDSQTVSTWTCVVFFFILWFVVSL